MTRRFWTEQDLDWLRKRYSEVSAQIIAKTLDRSPRSIYAKAKELGLKASPEKVARMASERTSRPEHGSRATRFQPGIVPWNKGRRGQSFEGTQATQFKVGNRPHTWVPVGSYRIDPDGYLQQKLNDDPGPSAVRWKPVHRLVWEAVHGPVPAGHAVVFKPGRRTTDPALITLDAVECITRRELMQRNTVHRYGPEIASVVQLRGALKRQINKLAKEAEQA